jgi:ribosomal protein S18 acetylase RimI-like enzyme
MQADQYQCVEYHRDNFTISNDRARLNIDTIHDFLTNRSYWSKGIPRDIVARAIANSMPFGVYDVNQNYQQVGFARVTTDLATFAYIADVFILESHRGHGLGKWLIECIISHPDLQGLRRFMLATRDAHGLYSQFGFSPAAHPENIMERRTFSGYDQR